MKIIKFISKDIKRISVVEIDPDGNVIIITGQNEQGKSSVLHSIKMALESKRELPPKPVRNGKKKGSVFLDLGECTVDWTITSKGRSSLVVLDKNGDPVKGGAQTFLKGIVGSIAFDPLGFSRETPAEQARVVRELAGITFEDLDELRATTYEARTKTNSRVKELETKINGMPLVDAPAEAVSMTDLLAELAAAEKANASIQDRTKDLERSEIGLTSIRADINEAKMKLERLLEKEEEAAQDIQTITDARNAGPAPVDVGEIKARIGTVEETNTLVRQAKERAGCSEELRVVRDLSRQQTSEIESIDDQKIERVAKADLPVPGLGFDEEGITIDGIPFEQCSSAQVIRTSLAMGIAMNPTLRVILIEEGSLLDKGSLALIAEMAEKLDVQVWIECVGDGSDGGILIEDGRVAEFVDVTDQKQIEGGNAEVNGS